MAALEQNESKILFAGRRPRIVLQLMKSCFFLQTMSKKLTWLWHFLVTESPTITFGKVSEKMDWTLLIYNSLCLV